MSNLIGPQSNQAAANGLFGRMAFQDPEGVVLEPQPSVTPNKPGDMVFQLSSNVSLTIKVCGSDGVVRSASLTLA